MENSEVSKQILDITRPYYDDGYMGMPYVPDIYRALDKGMIKYELDPDDLTLIVGYVYFRHLIKEDHTNLYKIAVRQGHYKKGIGQRLLDLVVNGANKKGKYCIIVDVVASNAGAIKFYENNGFKEIDKKEIKGKECVILKKTIRQGIFG